MTIKNSSHLLPDCFTKDISIYIPSSSVQDCLSNLFLIESYGFAKISQEQISFALSVNSNWSCSVSNSSGFLCLNSWALHNQSDGF